MGPPTTMGISRDKRHKRRSTGGRMPCHQKKRKYELVRTNTLVKNCVVQIDGTPFRQYYEKHYAVLIGEKKKKNAPMTELDIQGSKSVKAKIMKRREGRTVDPKLDEQFSTGRVFACISSRPGRSGRADGYILEGKELDFYMRKMAKKTKKA